jgi:hypothetical protein
MEFPVLTALDLQLIGVFIQEFNYMDFNLRRAIETFAHAKLLRGEAARTYPRIHSSKVSVTVQEAVKQMATSVENISETVANLVVIERRREIRNLLGHWAARRISGERHVAHLTLNTILAPQPPRQYHGDQHPQHLRADESCDTSRSDAGKGV